MSRYGSHRTKYGSHRTYTYAFRRQWDVVFIEQALRLHAHPLCITSQLIKTVNWKKMNTIGALFKANENRRNQFIHDYRTWCRQQDRFFSKRCDFVFIASNQTAISENLRDTRILFFKYRGDMTRALKELGVAEIMES